MNNVTVLGSGSWATAIVKILLVQKDTHVNWWVREPEIRQSLQEFGYNKLYLSNAELAMSQVTVFDDINQAVAASPIVFLVIPSAFCAASLSALAPELVQSRKWVSATKGLIMPEDLSITQYLTQHLGIPQSQIAVVSGPTHAEEVARKKLCYLTVASSNSCLVDEVRQYTTCHFVKTLASCDVLGIEYSTALKNVYALALGIAHGLGLGDNMQAVLVTSAAREMTSCLESLVPTQERCVLDSVYLGDLLVTCYSQHSRNRLFGSMIGRGYSIKAAQVEMSMVAEGYYAVVGLEHLRQRHGLNLPIVQGTYSILYENVPPQIMLRKMGELL